MSKTVFYLKVKPFIGQWLRFHFGNPVVFPSRSPENSCIHRLVSTTPVGHMPDKPDEESVAVTIPDTDPKRVITYNYMSKSACDVLLTYINDNFNMQLWNDLNEMTRYGWGLLKSVRVWCENNGVNPDYDYTLKMRYQRMRLSYRDKGIDFRKKERGKNELI